MYYLFYIKCKLYWTLSVYVSIVALAKKIVNTMKKNKIIIIGAGIGGLSSALQLAHQHYDVEVFETHGTPGGKLRTIDSLSGPIDGGPTVFTLKHIFESLFNDVGETIDEHLNLFSEPILARHFWPDGTILDLSSEMTQNYAALKNFAGPKAVKEFQKFSALTKNIFESFESPILHNPNPSIPNTIGKTSSQVFKLISALLPGRTLSQLVNSHFTDERLRQLFSRYATYVGGSPFNSPAILSLIWHAEALGVWRVQGGMYKLALKIKELAEKRGAKFHFNSSVSDILVNNGKVKGVKLKNGKEIFSDYIIFNGDPNAICTGLLGEGVIKAVPKKSTKERSLSAYVWTFSAKPSLKNLAHHNVFFNKSYKPEFDDIAAKKMPRDPTLYVCAQDKTDQTIVSRETKFEIIMNAAPTSNNRISEEEEFKLCHERTFKNLKKMGLSFDPIPSMEALTTPKKFSSLFPASNGSLYGLNPRQFMTTFKRPQAQTKIQGLYLAGGGVHPGPGIPMALLSGRHAAAAIAKDQTSI